MTQMGLSQLTMMDSLGWGAHQEVSTNVSAQLSLDENVQLISSLVLGCPPLPSGGLLDERVCLASLSVILVSGLWRS